MRTTLRFTFAAAVAALATTPALAHTGVEPHWHGFAAGLAHPLGGLDHLLAMVAVGIWSSLAVGRRVWMAPAIFVAAMLAGAGLGHAGIALPVAESAVAISVVAFGLMIVARVKVPVAAGAALVGVFAVFHGFTHGVEATGSIAGYMAGFAVTTASLHVAGIALGTVIARVPLAPRLVGAGIVASGAFLVAAL